MIVYIKKRSSTGETPCPKEIVSTTLSIKKTTIKKYLQNKKYDVHDLSARI